MHSLIKLIKDHSIINFQNLNQFSTGVLYNIVVVMFFFPFYYKPPEFPIHWFHVNIGCLFFRLYLEQYNLFELVSPTMISCIKVSVCLDLKPIEQTGEMLRDIVKQSVF